MLIKVSRDQTMALPIITALKMTLAGIAAFILMRLTQLPQGFWAIVTVAAVIQADFSDTLQKGVMRSIGTIIGAVLGVLCAFLIPFSPLLAILAFFICLIFSSYIAVQKSIYEYAAVVAGMTISIIIFFGVMGENIFVVSIDRTLEILIGVLVLFLINFIFSYLIKRWVPGWELPLAKSIKKPMKIIFNKHYLVASLRISLAAIATFLLWYFTRLPEGYWATISCLLIMEESLRDSMKRGGLRFLAHVIVIIIALVFGLLLKDVSYDWRILPMIIVFLGCGYLIGKKNNYSSMGNTIGIAFTIVLLAHTSSANSVGIIFARFYNVLIGVGVAFFALLIKVPYRLGN